MARALASGMRAALCGVLALLAGCVAVDATLRVDGSAHIVMLYRTPPDATEFLERRRFASPNVTVESVKIFEDQTTAVRATIHDVVALGTSRGFEFVDVARDRKGTDEEVTVTLRNPRPVTGDCSGGPSFTLSALLPGPVRSANHEAAVMGSRVTWQVPKCEYVRGAAVPLRVRYVPPPAG
jgi:hypothetical protein